MKLERDLLFLDLETTGVDPCVDQIVEIGVSVLHPDGTVNPSGWTRRFKPTMPIPAEATAIHGITDEDVAQCQPFASFAPTLHNRLSGKDLAGYNLARFDLVLLDEEFRRCGLRLNLDGVRVIDAAGIYFKKETRTLADAVRRFAKREPLGIHSAGNDAQDSLDSLLGQVSEFEDLGSMSVDELAAFSRMSEHALVDVAGKLYRDEAGYLCYNFGKNQGKRVIEESGYAHWMFKASFPGSTLEAIEVELNARK